ncbi:nitrate reductase cytochrome c-type subunit [Pseudothioclava arenosa]|uniref:Periplasmic nitrate reductase, electron transfer subunit n=1 Tax=Pseudothioclava arenosa TaxID=1795308 RepID=A0A2A4CUF7_9RHOB|nr:nitrate reductase cytochrome c-type subunit [Pseudothioclava arenosa]PCD77776.1 ferredoxin [Pseudothioclava arenosa]
MKRLAKISVLAGAAVAFSAGLVLAQDASVTSLRGAQVNEEVNVQDNYLQEKQRFARTFAQQPPLIPHTIEKYQIDLKTNECLTCHEWKNAADRSAPMISMTHYTDRDGIQGDQVASRRWFCNQCHVPQLDAPELVENVFRASGK